MDLRQMRGLEIAKHKQVKKTGSGWLVKSQSGKGFYRVGEDFDCDCLDCRERNVTCKHAYAVRFSLKAEVVTAKGKAIIEKRLTYPQAWALYDKSQQEEKARFMELLNDLCFAVPESEPAVTGRPRLNNHDLLFSAALKVYTRFSLRRFMSDLRFAKEKGFVEETPCFASVGHFIQKPELTPLLQHLITLSAAPLKSVEHDFAADSTGFTTTGFSEWLHEMHGICRNRKWLKCHAICGVKTNIITSAIITDKDTNDSPQFPTLVEATANGGFTVNEVSADMGYSAANNFNVVDDLGGKAFIPFKSNATGGGSGTRRGHKYHLFRKMFFYFQLHAEEFYEHYNKRSNIESTFSMIKAKFGDVLKSKTVTAQVNEALLKILCHNIVVLVHEANELGINPDFSATNPK